MGARKVSVTTGVGAGFEVTKGVVGVSFVCTRTAADTREAV